MIAKMISIVISLLLSVYFVFISVFYFLHESIKENVNQLNYGAAEVISTSGKFSKELYAYLSDHVGKYGDYRIGLKLEKQIKPGVYDVFFDREDILDKNLEVGDRVTLLLEDKKPTLFGRLVNATFLFYKPERHDEIHIKSLKTAMIAKSARNIVKGYDVIAEIERMAAAGSFSSEGTAVLVVTKLNTTGKYYGLAGHADVPSTNLHYGDSADETRNTGVNYIFDQGNFLKAVEYYSGGEEKLIQYIQQ